MRLAASLDQSRSMNITAVRYQLARIIFAESDDQENFSPCPVRPMGSNSKMEHFEHMKCLLCVAFAAPPDSRFDLFMCFR
jgi:hypothetical protein